MTDEKPGALLALLKALARSPLSSYELRMRLATKGYKEEEIDFALSRAQELGYVDDNRYGRDFVEMRHKRRPSGLALLRHELEARGLAPDKASQIIDEACIDEVESCARASSIWLSRHDSVEHQRQARARKLAMHLASRGFDSEVIRLTVSRMVGVDL